MAAESSERLNNTDLHSKSKCKRIPSILVHKCIFVCSISLLCFGIFSAVYRPVLMFVSFSAIFVILMIIRTVYYAKSKELLFMTGICYVVNILTLIFAWGFPSSLILFFIQFGLSNGPVYTGIFVYRNTFAFHHLDKMTTCFLHFFPPLFSYCIRWFPEHSSQNWWTPFVNSGAVLDVDYFNEVGSWIYIFAVPNAIFFVHTVLYHVIVHIIVKPSAKYNDSYRYLATKFTLYNKIKDCFPESCHLVLWMVVNILIYALTTLLACLAWCSFLVHSIMMILIIIAMSWNGACYYLDYFSKIALRRAIAKNGGSLTTKANQDHITLQINSGSQSDGDELDEDDGYDEKSIGSDDLQESADEIL